MILDPIGKMTPQEESDTLVEFGRDLLAAAPKEWTKIYYHFHGIAPYSTYGVFLKTIDGSEERFMIPGSTTLIVDRLRAGMYKEGRGTWFSMHYTITPPTHYDVTFNYDNPPDFLIPADPNDFLIDLRYFPRNPEHIPTWLQEKLDEARNQP